MQNENKEDKRENKWLQWDIKEQKNDKNGYKSSQKDKKIVSMCVFMQMFRICTVS